MQVGAIILSHSRHFLPYSHLKKWREALRARLAKVLIPTPGIVRGIPLYHMYFLGASDR